MFKASIALVLVAFAALAYGWIAGNDTILYASIGASALAGLALLRSSKAEKQAAAEGSAKPAPDRPSKPAKSRERDIGADFPPAADRRKRGRQLRAEELGRQLDTQDDSEFFDTSEPVKPFRPPSERQPLRKAPAGAAWAKPDELAEFQAEYDESSLEAGFEDQGYVGDEGYAEETTYSKQSAEAADDFRSRLAAVLGTAGETMPAPQPEPPPTSGRRKTRQVSPPPGEEAPAAPRRGRKKSTQPVVESETESQEAGEEPEPEWIRIDDVPRIRRATQPGGGFARPDLPQGVTPYRPRRPGVPKAEEAEPGEPAAPTSQRAAPAQRTAAAKAKPAATKRTTASAKPAVTRVSTTGTGSRASKEVDPDAPKPRRGRPPKPKP